MTDKIVSGDLTLQRPPKWRC